MDFCRGDAMMRSARIIWALQTSNKEAQALIARAQADCEGCRLSWRIRRDNRHDGTRIECTAQETRQQLREMSPTYRNRRHA